MKRFHVEPLGPDRWDDLVALFGPRGACGGCWCMFPRLASAQFKAQQGDANRRAMKRLVGKGVVPGLIGYDGDEPVAWVAVGPRAEYVRFERSRIAKPVDDTPAWSIVCLFIAKERRRRGLSRAMIEAAVLYARGQGATCVEAYPVEPAGDRAPDAFLWHGLASAYRAAGFAEVARRSPTRPYMRRSVR